MASADPIQAARSGHNQLINSRQLSDDLSWFFAMGGGVGLAMLGRGGG
jgi:hypothetical protein